MEQRLRASPEQFSVLIEFMERHGDLSRPQPGPQGRLRSDRLWQELTCLINSTGGGVQKTSDKWKKVWADWKTKTKKKYLAIRQHASGTGGGPSSRHSLTALEERVVAIIGVTAVVGQAGIQEQGFSRPLSETLAVSAHAENINSSEASALELSAPQYVVLEANYSQNIDEDPQISCPPVPTTISPMTRDTVSPLPPHPSPPPPPSPPALRTPPARSSRRQASASPRSMATTPRRRSLLTARRNRGLTPFDRAASEFVAIEQRRLEFEERSDRRRYEFEERRDRRLHERELRRMEIDRVHNELLHKLIDVLTRQQSTSLPSTDILQEES